MYNLNHTYWAIAKGFFLSASFSNNALNPMAFILRLCKAVNLILRCLFWELGEGSILSLGGIEIETEQQMIKGNKSALLQCKV